MANLKVFFSDVDAFLCSVKVAKRIDVISRQHSILDTDNVSRVHLAQSFGRSILYVLSRYKCPLLIANQFENCTHYVSIWSRYLII